MIILALILLIIFVIFSYFTLIDEGNKVWFMIDGDILIPTWAMEKIAQEPTMNLIKPTAWVFLGMILLLYLKILWKLIIFNWTNKSNPRIVKQKQKERG